MTLSAQSRLWLKNAIANTTVATEIADAIDAGVEVTSAEVTGSLLTGYTVALVAADLLPADTVKIAFGKLQKQVNDSNALIASYQPKLLTGYVVAGAAADIAATDTVLTAFGKIQKRRGAADTLIAGKQATLTMNRAATGTVGTIGQISVPGMAATGKVIANFAEAITGKHAMSHVVAGVNHFTVYGITTDTNTTEAIDTKLVNYIVISLT